MRGSASFISEEISMNLKKRQRKAFLADKNPCKSAFYSEWHLSCADSTKDNIC
jgi:hypothetical protein